MAASPNIDVAAWRAGFDGVFARIAGRFAQAASRKRARAYLLGLLSRTERQERVDDSGVRRGRHAGRDAAAVLGDGRPGRELPAGVFLAYAVPGGGRAMIDRELYLPRSWTGDRNRCREAGIGEDVAFATKPELAQAMISRAIDAGVPFGWVAADAGISPRSRRSNCGP